MRRLRVRILPVLVLLAGVTLVAPVHAQPAPPLRAHASADLTTLKIHQAADAPWRRQLATRLAQQPDAADAQLLLDRLTHAAHRHQAAFARALQSDAMRAIIRAAGWPTPPAPGWQPTPVQSG